jgi:hypothetical protein
MKLPGIGRQKTRRTVFNGAAGKVAQEIEEMR